MNKPGTVIPPKHYMYFLEAMRMCTWARTFLEKCEVSHDEAVIISDYYNTTRGRYIYECTIGRVFRNGKTPSETDTSIQQEMTDTYIHFSQINAALISVKYKTFLSFIATDDTDRVILEYDKIKYCFDVVFAWQRIHDVWPDVLIGGNHRKTQAARRLDKPGSNDSDYAITDRNNKIRKFYSRLIKAGEARGAVKKTAETFGLTVRSISRILKSEAKKD